MRKSSARHAAKRDDVAATATGDTCAPWDTWDEEIAADGTLNGKHLSSMSEMFNYFADLASEKIAHDVGIAANFGAGEYVRSGGKRGARAGQDQSFGFASAAAEAEPAALVARETEVNLEDEDELWSEVESSGIPETADFLHQQLQMRAASGSNSTSAATATPTTQRISSGKYDKASSRVPNQQYEDVRTTTAATTAQGEAADVDAALVTDSTAHVSPATSSMGAAWRELPPLPARNPQVEEFLTQAFLHKLPFLGVSEEVLAQQLHDLESEQTSLSLSALLHGEYQLDLVELGNFLQAHLSVNALAYWSLSELERELVLEIVDYHDPLQYDRDNRMINYLYFVNLRLLELLREIHVAESSTPLSFALESKS